MDKTRDSTNSKIWPDSTCAIRVRRKGQILLVVESLVLSTTLFQNQYSKPKTQDSNTQELRHVRLAILRCALLIFN